MATYTRGTLVFFSTSFTDKDGNPATPTTATLYLVFVDPNGVRQKISMPMTIAGNVASVSWDSTVASDCTVEWSIKGTGLNAVVQDGNFTLGANEANPLV